MSDTPEFRYTTLGSGREAKAVIDERFAVREREGVDIEILGGTSGVNGGAFVANGARSVLNSFIGSSQSRQRNFMAAPFYQTGPAWLLAAVAATLLVSACGKQPVHKPAVGSGEIAFVDVAGEVAAVAASPRFDPCLSGLCEP